jgi:threonine dehydrogenase-like Zn-dependent dehydrogenase
VRALFLREPLSIALTDKPEPRQGIGEALVRVRSIGICGSDLHAFRGHHPFVTYPRVLGHELGVEIVEIAPNERGLAVGDKVCIEPILNCGECYPCRQGRYNCCTRIKVLGIHTDGGMTERISVPIKRLHKPSVDLSFDELALCETLSIGVQAVKRAELKAGETVVILGAGPIGLGLLIAARARGGRCLVSDPLERNRKAALAMGAESAVDPLRQDLTRSVMDWAGDDGGAHVVFEAVGLASTISQAVDLAAPTGRIVIIGVSKERVPISIADLMRKEIDFRTTRNSSGAFPDVLDLFRKHRAELGTMLTHHFPLEDGPRVFNWLHEARDSTGVIKAVLNVD